MKKAPYSSGSHVHRKTLEPSISRTSSKSTESGPTWTSAAPSPSSATSGHQSPSLTQFAQRYEPASYTRGSDSATYDVSDVEDEIFDATGEHRIVLAIDYGTTFTGIACATPDNDNAKLSQIHVIQDWGNKMDNDVKIPSVISYSPRSIENERQFGADLSPNAVAFVNTKLELDVQDTRLEELDLILQVLDGMKNLNFNHVKASKGYPAYTWKQPEDIVMDYLTKAFECFMMATEYMAAIRATAPVDVIITVPVSWSYRAKNSTLKAIRNAGFNQANFPRLQRYVMVTEPEAAAIYTARYLQEQGAGGLKLGECFILCDAGGGTVDVVSYKVKRLNPSLELEAITKPAGRKCGSSFINADFKKWLRRVLGVSNYNELDPRNDGQRISANATEGGAMREVMKAFEKHKKLFHQKSTAMHIDLPGPLQSLSIPNRVEQGDLTITNHNMRSFFHSHVDEVIELIQGQITQVEERRNRVKTIILIGGFGESKYLQQELDYSMRERDVVLRRPETSWSAVVRGAVLYGMELANRQKEQVMIPCPRNYGIRLHSPYSRKSHNRKDAYTDGLTDHVMASNQMYWLVRKGDLLLATEERDIEIGFVGKFQEGDSRQFPVPVYEYPDDDAPDRYNIAHEELKVAATMTANFAGYPLERFEKFLNINTGVAYYQAQLTLKLMVKGMSITGELWWYDQQMDVITIPDIDKTLTGQQTYRDM